MLSNRPLSVQIGVDTEFGKNRTPREIYILKFTKLADRQLRRTPIPLQRLFITPVFRDVSGQTLAKNDGWFESSRPQIGEYGKTLRAFTSEKCSSPLC